MIRRMDSDVNLPERLNHPEVGTPLFLGDPGTRIPLICQDVDPLVSFLSEPRLMTQPIKTLRKILLTQLTVCQQLFTSDN